MSNREEILIEADDVTLMQGEKNKDYSIKITKTDGTPIPNLPVTIAFYNMDYSFQQDTQTNRFGVASAPIYLTGETWKVDTHFKGNKFYLPNYVTKDITIEKFERLASIIESENLHINEDDVISTGEGYYTIKLTDENELPIANEPISFTIISSKNSVDDVNVIIKTDDEGKIVLPYLTHDDTVTIVSEYKGCTRYGATINTDVVSFDDISNRTEVFFGEYNDGQGNNFLQIKRGEQGQWQGIYNSGLIERCIVNYAGDDRTVHDGILYYRSSNINSYQITLFYKGDSNYFSKCETLYFNKESDIRMALLDWIEAMTGDITQAYGFTMSSNKKGTLNRVLFETHFELPYEFVYLGVKLGTYSGTYDFVVKTLPRYDVDEVKGETHTILEFDIINSSGISSDSCYFGLFMKPNDYIKNSTNPDYDIPITSRTQTLTNNSREEALFVQNGFGHLGRTYQDMDVMVRNNQAISYDKINEYYVMRLLNTDTYEEFYFYSYLVDNVTPSHLSFLLGLGNWELYVVSKETSTYRGCYYSASAELDTEDFISYNMDTFFDSSKWTDNGDGHISDYMDNTGRTIEYGSTQFNQLYSVMNTEYTQANIYKLKFTWEYQYHNEYGFNDIIINADNENYVKFNPYKVVECRRGIIIEDKIIDSEYLAHTTINVTIQRKGDTFDIYFNDNLVYSTDNAFTNIFGVDCMGQAMYTKISNIVIDESVEPIDITPSTDDYDGSIYGSDIHLEIRDDKVSLLDYGMLPSGAVGGAKVVVNDVPVSANNLELRMEMRYNNTRYERLNDLTGEMQVRTYENVNVNDSLDEYSKVLCSPMPVPNVETVFTRHSEEGILYYVKDPRMNGNISPTYLCNAYTKYKGGVEIKSETGIFLFSLDNAFSPVFVGNNLVRAEFHRRSGYIKLSKWDHESGSWYVTNILKIKGTPQLKLIKYNDDYAEIQFGQTTWKFFRGRPFIIVNHPNNDLRILNLVDRVYCEILENNRTMGVIEEKDALCGVFEPQLSIQRFKQELHIGQNIRLDNFEVYDVAQNNYLEDPSTTNELRLSKIDNDNAVTLVKNTIDKVALNFPSYSQYVKNYGYDAKNSKLLSDFSLLIQTVRTENCTSDSMNVTVIARGFDERGAIPVRNQIQYGIWQQSHTVEVDTNIDDTIRVEFINCPSEVKYIDFVLVFDVGDDEMSVTMKDFMYYEGKDMSLNHDVDTSVEYANKVDIIFNETYLAKLYNEDDSFGLAVIRPNQHSISLRSIYASEETVLVPYMKKSTSWDKPEQIFLEYLNARKQIMDIDWEN